VNFEFIYVLSYRAIIRETVGGFQVFQSRKFNFEICPDHSQSCSGCFARA